MGNNTSEKCMTNYLDKAATGSKISQVSASTEMASINSLKVLITAEFQKCVLS